MLHDSHVISYYEDMLWFWNTNDINRAMWLEKDYAEMMAEQKAVTSIFYKDELEI